MSDHRDIYDEMNIFFGFVLYFSEKFKKRTEAPTKEIMKNIRYALLSITSFSLVCFLLAQLTVWN